MPIARGTLLGFIIGIIRARPTSFRVFSPTRSRRRVSKHPEEFGKGAVAGVAGPETANNAASTGAFRTAAGARHSDQPDHRSADRRSDDSRRFGGSDTGQRAS